MSNFWGGPTFPAGNRNAIEKLHFMACKQFLWCKKQSTNIGVLIELGRVPLQPFRSKADIKDWERINTGKMNLILKESHSNAIIENFPWITQIGSVLEQYNFESRNLSSRRKYPFIHNYYTINKTKM